MEQFDVRTHSIDVLEDSEFIDQLQSESGNPVLVTGGFAYSFGVISGGYSKDIDANILELAEPDGAEPDGAVPDNDSSLYEVHFNDCSYDLYVNNSYKVSGSGSERLLLEIAAYNRYGYGFAEEMREDIDGRETQYS
jgi:hypothetical protein